MCFGFILPIKFCKFKNWILGEKSFTYYVIKNEYTYGKLKYDGSMIDCIQYWQKELHILFCSITPTNLGQFSKPGIDLKSASLTFLKHPLHIQFHQVLDEILKVKDTWYQSFIFMIIDLLEMKITEIWTICSKNGSVYHQRYQYQQE